MSILIVDDQPDNIFLVRRLLEKAGFQELYTAKSAQEAFDLLGLSKDQVLSQGVDLILMDVMMPQMNGIDACRHLKQNSVFGDIPVIMMTALTDEEYLQDAFEAGAVDYVTKPLRAIELLSRMRSALRLKQEMDCRKKHEKELSKRNQDLEKALGEIKTLRGFLPICCYCKKIRDVQGLWQQMEAYISDHADVVFSHGICDPCMKAHYPAYTKQAPSQNKPNAA